MKNARSRCSTLLWLIAALAAFGGESRAGERASDKTELPQDKDFHAYRVTAVQKPMNEKTYAVAFARGVDFCRELGRNPGDVPEGVPLIEINLDTYYNRYAVTEYKYHKQYQISVTKCVIEVVERSTAQMYTGWGLCKIDLKRQRAVGQCDAQKVLSRKPFRYVPYPPTPILETKRIAGEICDVTEWSMGTLRARDCRSNRGPFIGPATGLMIRNLGLVLKRETWSDRKPEFMLYNVEATKVYPLAKVSLGVMAPHTVGGYTVKEIVIKSADRKSEPETDEDDSPRNENAGDDNRETGRKPLE